MAFILRNNNQLIMKNQIFKSINKKLCPLIQNPLDECYCSAMTSQDIERTVYLCSSNFQICDIYRNGNGWQKKEKTKTFQQS